MTLVSSAADPRDDAAAEYWQSEHHRMEFSELKPLVNELDPNSLHQVGIAVPGNYVNKGKFVSQSLLHLIFEVWTQVLLVSAALSQLLCLTYLLQRFCITVIILCRTNVLSFTYS